MRRASILVAPALLVLTGDARGEVRVELNSAGHVNEVRVHTDLESGTVWGRLSSDVPDNQLLNPDGDAGGDRLPTCGILALPTQDAMKHPPHLRVSRVNAGTGADPGKRRTPIVAWPRFDGNDWEIVYSVWDYRSSSWRATARVEPGDNDVEDFDPQLEIRGKRVMLYWRRGTEGNAFAMTTAELIPVGDVFDLVWAPAVELTGPPSSGPSDPIGSSLPELLGTGIGHSELTERIDE